MMTLKIFAAIYGLCIGSFLNVLIYRLPLDKNIVQRSFCPHCSKKIPWYFNIPLLSYLFLKGKCHSCSKKISFKYPLIESITGLAAFLLFPDKIELFYLINYLFFFSIFCIFLAHFVIDIEHKILPDSLNLALFLLLLSYAVINLNPIYYILGGLLGLLFPLSITWIFYKLKGKIGLGGGDIKLYAILGIYLGPKGIAELLFFSCFLGTIVGGFLILTKRMTKDTPMAFGPFILLVAFVQIFFPHLFNRINFFAF